MGMGGRGGGGGASEVLPLQKGRREQVFAMLKWGGGGVQKVLDPDFSHFVSPLSP